MPDENNLRPAFYLHLGNAFEAAEAVDYFDLTDDNRAEFVKLNAAQAETSLTLIDFIQRHGSKIRAQVQAAAQIETAAPAGDSPGSQGGG